MANFLDDLSIYNAKAAAAISAAVVECNNEKANMMSSLKTTANDITLSEEIRLNALTALINLGNLLDVPLPPYFPVVTTYANTQEYVGIHNDLQGLQGGAPGEYYHLTAQEKNSILNKASLGDITWGQLGGVYSDNAIFGPQFDGKQNALSAPDNNTYYVRITGNTIFYDNSVPTASITGIVAGGELTGTYPNPGLSNAAVISKVLTGWNGTVTGTITASDTILTALQKLNANINNVITNPSGVSSVALTNNAPLVFTTTTSPQTGIAGLNLGLNTQNANLFLASPNGTSGLPSFRAMVNADLPVSGAAAGNYGSNTSIPQITVNAQGIITAITTVTAASGGQVNTVGLSVPGILSPSSVTGTATDPVITLALDVQPANYVWAGPTTGVDAVPFFRLLIADDIPQLPLTKITGLQDAIANKLDNELNDGEIWIGNDVDAPQMRSLTQDILITNTGVVTIQPNVVNFGKMQQITGANTGVTPNIPGNLLGRWAAGTGNIQEITLSSDFVLSVSTGTLSLAVPVAPVLTTKGGLITYSQSVGAQVQLSAVYEGRLLMTDSGEDKGIKWVEAQGDIEVNTTLLDGTFNIKSNAVTLGKIQQLPAYTVIGNATNATATPTPLTKTQLTTLVNQFTIDTAGGNTALPGVVPGFNINGFPAGKSASDYFLNAAGGWSLGGGGSGSGTVLSGGPDQLAYYSALGTVVQGWVSSSSLIYSNPSGAIQNLSYTGQNGLYLKVNSSSGLLEWASAGSGSGTVVSGTVNQVAYYSAPTSVSSTTIAGADGTKILSQVVTAGVGATPSWLAVTGTGNVVLDTSPTMDSPYIGTTATTGHIHFRKAGASIPPGFANTATLWFPETGGSKRMAIMWDNLGYASQFQLNATQSRTYTFPDATGEVALISAARTLTVSSSGGNAGKIALGGSSSGTITLQAPATVTVSEDLYTLPSAYPLSPTGYYLTSDGSGVLTWEQVLSNGDVVGPAGATVGNFAVFSNSSGKDIAEPTNAFLTQSGRATFNDGVNIGDASSATGTLTFAHASTSSTTTFIAPGTPATSATYIWPTGPGLNGNTLTWTTGGQLAWSAAGTGDLTKAGTNQVVTGDIRFRSTGSALAGLVLRNSAGDYATTFNMSSVGTAGTTYITTFQPQSGIVPLLESVNTWTGGNTFSSTFTASSTATFSGLATFQPVSTGTTASLLINVGGAGTHQFISFTGTSPFNTPTITSRSVGTRIVLANTLAVGRVDAAIGTNQRLTGTQYQSVWISAPEFIDFFPTNLQTTPSVRCNAYGLNMPLAFNASFGCFSGDGWINLNRSAAPSTTVRTAGTAIVFGDRSASVNYDSAIGNWQESGGANFNSLWLSAANKIRFYLTSNGNAFVFDSAGLSMIGNLVLNTVGNGISIKEGANATMGVATLVAGTVTVSTTKATTNSRIMITAQTNAGTEYGMVKISGRVNATSFTITSYRGNNTTTVATGDTSTVAWIILDPA